MMVWVSERDSVASFIVMGVRERERTTHLA